MRLRLSKDVVGSELVKKIEEISGESLLKCYQCGNCSAGCPFSFAMDILPNTISRLLRLGQVEEVLNSKTFWICASCLTCAARCPKGVNLPRILEALRIIALKEKKDYCGPNEVPANIAAEAPQQGLISCFKKYCS